MSRSVFYYFSVFSVSHWMAVLSC